MKNKFSGFTVIELLVVIAIIGILSTIIIAFLSTQNAKANDKKIMQQLSSMRSQANLYTGNNMALASTAPLTGLEDNMFGNTAPGIDSLYLLIKGLPAGTHYVYGSDGNAPAVSGQWYFAAMLSDGQSDCVDWAGAATIGVHTFDTTTPPTTVGDWAGVVNTGTYSCR